LQKSQKNLTKILLLQNTIKRSRINSIASKLSQKLEQLVHMLMNLLKKM